MAIEVEAEFQCLVEYFARQLAMEALIALKNVIILLKSLLALYLLTNVQNLIDKTVEDAIVGNITDNPVSQAIDEAVRQVNEVRDLMPPDGIAECAGANKVLESVDLAMSILFSFKSLSDSYGNRYAVVSFIEGFRQEIFNRTLELLDILLTVIEAATVKKVEEGIS